MQRERFQDITKNLNSGDTITIPVDDFNQGIKEVQSEIVKSILKMIEGRMREARMIGGVGEEWKLGMLALLKDDIEIEYE